MWCFWQRTLLFKIALRFAIANPHCAFGYFEGKIAGKAIKTCGNAQEVCARGGVWCGYGARDVGVLVLLRCGSGGSNGCCCSMKCMIWVVRRSHSFSRACRDLWPQASCEEMGICGGFVR